MPCWEIRNRGCRSDCQRDTVRRTSWETPPQTLVLCGRQLTHGQGHPKSSPLVFFDITAPSTTDSIIWYYRPSAADMVQSRLIQAAAVLLQPPRFTPADRRATAAGPTPKNRGAAGPLLMPLLESRQRTAESPAQSRGLQPLKLLQLDPPMRIPPKPQMPLWSRHVAL